MWILSPLSWLMLGLGACAAACLVRRGRRWLLGPGICMIAVALLAMTPAVANLLVGWLERAPGQPATCIERPPDVAVVLAGGIDGPARSEDDIPVLGIASRRRADAALAWWRAGPGRQLVVAGGSREPRGVPEAVLVAGYLRRLGVPGSAIRVETESLDTWQNAHRLAALRPALPRDVVLVTSDMHRRRAAWSLRQAGFTPCLASADPRYVPFRRPGYLVPDSGGLAKSEAALHELAGLVAYRLRRPEARDQPGGSLDAPPP